MQAKPGDICQKKWVVINNGNIAWPQSKIRCLNLTAQVQIPEIDFILLPGDSIELTINIKISTKNENHIEQYGFQFYSDKHGDFGELLEATIEVTPNDMK